MAAATSRDVFRFCDLPAEIRNQIYRLLIQSRSHRALIQTSSHRGTAHPVRLSFRHVWMPLLLLVSKQFGAEYFHEVCTHRLYCSVDLNGPRRDLQVATSRLQLNPISAMKALSKTPRLVGRAAVMTQPQLDGFNTSLDDIFPSLLPAMPNLQIYDEYLSVLAQPLSRALRSGNSMYLDAINNEKLGGDDNAREKKFRTLLANSRTKSTEADTVTFKREAYVGEFLYSELSTREGNPDTWVLFTAMPRIDGEVDEEYLWHGLELTQFLMKDDGESRAF